MFIWIRVSESELLLENKMGICYEKEFLLDFKMIRTTVAIIVRTNFIIDSKF